MVRITSLFSAFIFKILSFTLQASSPLRTQIPSNLCRRMAQETRYSPNLLFGGLLEILLLCDAGGTCPTCRHDPLQSTLGVSRPVAVEPAADVVPAPQRDEDLQPSMEQVRPMDSDSDGLGSMEAEDAPVAERGAAACLESQNSDTAGCEPRLAVVNSRERNSSSGTADENSVLVWSP
jgi:hypothetical protein